MDEEYTPPRRFPGIRRQVSLFFGAALLGIVAVTLFVSYKQGVFVRHTPIYFYAADAFGIGKGMAVKLFGLQVGSVRNMEVSGAGVKVELSIVGDYTEHIPKGSSVRLVREGYIGAASIQIVPSAGATAEPIAAGDVLEFVRSRGMTELIDDLKNQITPVLKDLSRVIAKLGDPDSDIHRTAAAARTLLEQLPATNDDARRVLRNVDHTVVAVGNDARTALGTVARVGAQAEQQLPVLANKLSTTLDSLAETSAQVRDTVRETGEAVRQTGEAAREALARTTMVMRQGEELVQDSQDTVGAARRIWPLSGAVEAPQMRTLPVDSYDSAAAARDFPAATGR
ncbi:MAG TPA: MlaD family protein [Burkholderiales bacterium]|nr:MlaD family protein [Burkholderiales bacterium]